MLARLHPNFVRTAMLLLVVWLHASRALALDRDERASHDAAHPTFARGAQEISMMAGYGLGIGKGLSADVRLWLLAPHWGIALTHPFGTDHWYAGCLSLLIEGAYLHSVEPFEGNAGTAASILRQHFLALQHVVPFVEAGAGLGAVGFDLQGEQRNGFNFVLLAGVGAHVVLVRPVWLTLETRFHHISNAGLREPNNGIDAFHFLGGLTFFAR